MKFAVVTGAAGGIGAAICKTYRDVGWRVLGIDLVLPSSKLKSVAYYVADLTDDIQLVGLTHLIQSQTKAIHCLINCAGVQYVKPFDKLSAKEWDHSMGVNARAPFLLSQQLSKQLVRAAERSGDATIINIGSVHAKVTAQHMAAYAASKAALHSLTTSASIDFAPYGIRVNTITPGAVDTSMLVAHLSPSKRKKLLDRLLVKELVPPSEIAAMAVYLSSPAARHITGQEFVIDAGALTQLATEVA